MDMINTMPKSSMIKTKSRKSISINRSPINTSDVSTNNIETPKTILKMNKRQHIEAEEEDEVAESERMTDETPVVSQISDKPTPLERRPFTLDEYIKEESLIIDPTSSSFVINEIDEDDELWLFDMPKTLNPHELKGQTFYFGDRTKFKIGNERYLAVSNDNVDYFTCIMGTGRENKRFKTINIQPSGSIVIRKKLSNGNDIIINDDDEGFNSTVPFPENIKIRHPLKNIQRCDRKMKKISSINSRIKKPKSESSD